MPPHRLLGATDRWQPSRRRSLSCAVSLCFFCQSLHHTNITSTSIAGSARVALAIQRSLLARTSGDDVAPHSVWVQACGLRRFCARTASEKLFLAFFVSPRSLFLGALFVLVVPHSNFRSVRIVPAGFSCSLLQLLRHDGPVDRLACLPVAFS